MGIYLVKGKGWRSDFTLNGKRYTMAWFTTKRQAKEAEARKRQELQNPPAARQGTAITPTDMGFLELVNRRLDYVKAYRSRKYYVDHLYTAKKFVREWQGMNVAAITPILVQEYLIKRSRISAHVANKDLRYLRALFNFGIRRGLSLNDPTKGLEFMPIERRLKYVPSKEDVAKVLLAADPDTQDYLLVICETMARMGEVNQLTWEDVDFERRCVVLYTRKKKGGHLTPRRVPMTNRLHAMLMKRFRSRDRGKPWVFWQRYWSREEGRFLEGPYQDRKKIMRTLCQKAGVRYFRFHALRHLGASILEKANVPIGSIQRLLGHENRTTTEIYLHSIGEAEREAMAVFERVGHEAEVEENLTQTLTQNKNEVASNKLSP